MSKKKKSSPLHSIRITRANVPHELAELRRNHLNEIFDNLPNSENTLFTSFNAGLAEKDKRRFRPDFRQRRILRSDSSVSRLTSRGKFARISFDKPYLEFPCRKRKARRQVLFALKLSGFQ